MDNLKIINSLRDLGLTQYEAKVYMTLVSKGILTAREISNICSIPYGKVYEIFSSLANKGFVLILPTKPMKCKPVDPQEIIGLIKKRSNERLEIAEKIIKKELGKIFKKNEKIESTPFLIINGRAAINRVIEEFFKKVKNKILIITPKCGLSRLKYYSEILKELKKKGVNISIFTKTTDLESLNFCKVSYIDLSTPNFFISIDEKESLLFEPIPEDENLRYGMDVGILIKNQTFTKFIEQFLKRVRKIENRNQSFR